MSFADSILRDEICMYFEMQGLIRNCQHYFVCGKLCLVTHVGILVVCISCYWKPIICCSDYSVIQLPNIKLDIESDVVFCSRDQIPCNEGNKTITYL